MYIKKKILHYIFILTGLIFLILAHGCKKDKKETPAPETGTVIDIDGNTYKTIKIGHQWWMAENLRTTRYNDSTKISLILIPNIYPDPNKTWEKDTTGQYCISQNEGNNADFIKKYGGLYNWYAVNNSKKIAPKGWHIPSDDEWKELEYHLGMTLAEIHETGWRGSHEGEKLKTATPRSAWISYGDIWATNESGFTALAGGCCMFDGRFGVPGINSVGFWWSATSQGNEAWYRYLDYKNANVFRYYGPKTYGFSVRCVKD